MSWAVLVLLLAPHTAPAMGPIAQADVQAAAPTLTWCRVVPADRSGSADVYRGSFDFRGSRGSARVQRR